VKLDQSRMELGFKRCSTEHAMYMRGNSERRLVVGVYVDDLIIISRDIDVLSEFKDQMLKAFKLSELGPLGYYLRIEVQQSVLGITISQGAYAEKILNKAGLSDSNSYRTPLEARLEQDRQHTEG
jgi:hypothetical protein